MLHLTQKERKWLGNVRPDKCLTSLKQVCLYISKHCLTKVKQMCLKKKKKFVHWDLTIIVADKESTSLGWNHLLLSPLSRTSQITTSLNLKSSIPFLNNNPDSRILPMNPRSFQIKSQIKCQETYFKAKIMLLSVSLIRELFSDSIFVFLGKNTSCYFNSRAQ